MSPRFLTAIGVLLLSLTIEHGAAAQNANATFDDIVEREWQWRLADQPRLAAAVQPGTISARMERVDEQSQVQRKQYWTAILADLDKLEVEQLDPARRVDLRIFRDQLRDHIADIRFASYRMPLNGDSSFYAELLHYPERVRLGNDTDAEIYLRFLADIPRYLRDQQDLMRKGLETGHSVPRIVLEGREAPARAEAERKSADESPFFSPMLRLEDGPDPQHTEQLRERARVLIREDIRSAYAQLTQFLVDEYLPQTRTSIAAGELPDGQQFYRQKILEFTTLELDAQTIHDTGLREVARIRQEMLAIVEELEFDGELADFIAYLRSDPQFYARTPRELLMHARDIAKRIDAKLPAYFGLLPRRPYGVAPVPAAIAPFYTSGRYASAAEGSEDPGYYWVNTYRLDSRPLFTLPALTLHEAVPGHHLQIALASEQGSQRPFRRFSYLSVYGEGWALYAEHLGVEMGIYETPYEQFGRLTYEMWRACRLVVDTGMHALGWSRERSLDYLRAHTALSELEIVNEIDRYIDWPGQALSYKIGELKIRELRAKASAKLGAAFDLRAFHDALLALGSVPMGVLDDAVDEFIAARRPSAENFAPAE